jgi:hypothetical protein
MTRREGSVAPSIAPSSLVEDLLRASEGESFVFLQGFPAAGKDEAIRLYQDLTLSTYLEVNKADIIRLIQASEDAASAIVAVRSSARITGVAKGIFAADADSAIPCRGSQTEFEDMTPLSYSPDQDTAVTKPAGWVHCQIGDPIWRYYKDCHKYLRGSCIIVKVFVGFSLKCRPVLS